MHFGRNFHRKNSTQAMKTWNLIKNGLEDMMPSYVEYPDWLDN